MKWCGALVSIMTLFFAADVNADNLSIYSYRVSFKTISCNGSKGFATIDADKLDKIRTVKCDKADVLKEVYQVLVIGEPSSGTKYRVFTTSEVEAEKIMKHVNAYQDTKVKSLENSNRIIIDNVK